jgi:hypothetical protein
MKNPATIRSQPRGFALVVTLSLMILLTVIAVGLLGLSAIGMRTTGQDAAQAQARANARLALMLALGELQKEMGPDMRVSAEAALFDQDKDSEAIEGVAQPHWLASYESWGNWLNADYALPDGGGTLKIQDTYGPRRSKMFRHWLLSLPEGLSDDDKAPLSLSDWDDTNSVVLVGEGSLGRAAQRQPNLVTRAYLTPIITTGKTGKTSTTGRQAWWIGPENHKAKISLAKQPRTLAADAWEAAQGATAEVGVGGLQGFGVIDSDHALSDKLITPNTLRAAKVAADLVQGHFFDLTAHSQGIITSVRTGQLKKDLSLLLEKSNSSLPAPYRFSPGSDIREPSIRPMTADLQAKNPKIPNRQFASWTNMRHFYRMYRSGSDATIGGTGGAGALNWAGSKPSTDVVSTADLGSTDASVWNGSNNYWRIPILAKITFIYSLLTEPATTAGRYKCYHVYSPVFTYWNPYNTELRVPDGKITMASSAYRVWPNSGEFYLGDTVNKNSADMGAFGTFGYSQGINSMSALRSGTGGDIVFKPGEFRVFSHTSSITTGSQATSGNEAPLYPGFDPQAIGGEKKDYGPYSPNGSSDGTFSPNDKPGLTVMFTHGLWGGNINRGNTGGSLCWQDWWDRPVHGNGMPMTYANDWLNKAQTMTPMTPPGLTNVARWVFSDSAPVPVAFCQLVIKGLSEYNYESITWDKDWRSRNWIQSPPFYFGNGMYCSENDTIAHTQRIDNPYVMFFGPMSMSEMPIVVGQLGQNSFLGSGSSPFEQVTGVSALELPTAPPGSLAAFSTMRINPGWLRADQLGSHLHVDGYGGSGLLSTGEESLYCAETKRVAYQSGVTGPGIGNSFAHPMIARGDVYHYIDNSKSEDVPDRNENAWMNTIQHDTMAYCDYWDHVFLLNDALWDDYFVSSLADQKRPGAGSARSLSDNIDRLVDDKDLSNTRYRYYPGDQSPDDAKAELQAGDGYLKVAKHLVVNGMFNVNSTSVAAWQALFAGIRERQLVFRDSSGTLKKIGVPSGKRIAISRFDTEVSDQEMSDPKYGVTLSDGSKVWSGVRFLSDDQLLKLAEQCVKQVKSRGPFLNFAEFINRRLSNDELGLMGALQSAIDYDDQNPDSKSLNYRFKNGPDFMLKKASLGTTGFSTPEAAEGSRFAGIPGYIIQSDLLRPIANTLSVRDDTFRIRAYGEALDSNGKVSARAWCEAVVQRLHEYGDPTNEVDVAARTMDASGKFDDNNELTPLNLRFGRKFRIESFRWLNANEV